LDKDMKILIVDDFSTMRRIIKNLLRDLGFNNTQEADDGNSALPMLQNGNFDFLVTDWNMPGMTGIELLDHTRRVAPGAKRVLLTAYADTDVAIKAINDIGLDHYLMKPWSPPDERLYPVLDDLLADPGIRLGNHTVATCQEGLALLQGRTTVGEVFMEKPLATDGPGLRRIMAANEEAKKKGLQVSVGHHLRHEDKHREVVKRIRDGAIGKLMYTRVYFNTNAIWVRGRRPDQTEMEYQVNNWYHFTWLSGDHICEQHVHDLDVGNWFNGDAHPIEAQGMGGQQVCRAKDQGEILDWHNSEENRA